MQHPGTSFSTLSTASVHRSLTIVEIMNQLQRCRAYSVIAAGVHVDLVDKLGRTALFTACLEGHENVAELLLKYGADVNLSVFSFSDFLDLHKNGLRT